MYCIQHHECPPNCHDLRDALAVQDMDRTVWAVMRGKDADGGEVVFVRIYNYGPIIRPEIRFQYQAFWTINNYKPAPLQPVRDPAEIADCDAALEGIPATIRRKLASSLAWQVAFDDRCDSLEPWQDLPLPAPPTAPHTSDGGGAITITGGTAGVSGTSGSFTFTPGDSGTSQSIKIQAHNYNSNVRNL